MSESSFSRGREIIREQRARRVLDREETVGLRKCFCVLAIHDETGKQSLVGCAFSRAGMGRLIAERRSEFPAHKFHEVETYFFAGV